MKKIILLGVILIGLTFSTQAQDIPDVPKNAFGLRLNSRIPQWGVSYQRWLSDSNRLELDLTWGDKITEKTKLSLNYQRVWNISGGLTWYAGVGLGYGKFSDFVWIESLGYEQDVNGYCGFAAGRIGIQYNFGIPLQLSFDINPEIKIFEKNKSYISPRFVKNTIALSIQYRF